jgi:hypothetical protein
MIAHYTSHVTRHTSHVTRHTSHVTRHLHTCPYCNTPPCLTTREARAEGRLRTPER